MLKVFTNSMVVTKKSPSKSIGLYNVIQRLEDLYGLDENIDSIVSEILDVIDVFSK